MFASSRSTRCGPIASRTHRATATSVSRSVWPTLPSKNGEPNSVHHAPAVLAELLWRALASRAADGVAHREVLGERDALAKRAAEQLVDRHAGELPADVPQRHLDRAIRADHVEAVGVVQRLHGRNGRRPAAVQVGGAASEQSRRKLLRDDRRVAPVPRFAELR